MILKHQLKLYQYKVNQLLKTFFIEKEKEFLGLSEIAVVIRDLRDFVLAGGKRLRGFLVLLGYQFDGDSRRPERRVPTCRDEESNDFITHEIPRLPRGNVGVARDDSDDDWRENQEILKFSAGVELLHAALLAHDDIIDKDKLRRGIKTLHEKYGKIKAQHIANLLFSFGSEIIIQTNFPTDRKIKALNFIREKLFHTALGEILDVHFSGRLDLKKSNILKIHTLKTANYTIEGPLISGIILAGGDTNMITGLRDFSAKLGQAFQIKDDLLGIFGSSKIVGKTVGSDLREGKETFIIKKIKDLQPAIFKKEIIKFFGKEKLTPAEEQKFKKILAKSKIKKEVEREALNLTKEAKKIISKFPLSVQNKKLFSELADYMVYREK